MYCTSTIFLAEYTPPVGTIRSPGVGSTFIDALSLVLFCLTEATSNSSLPSLGKGEIDATGDCSWPAGAARIPIVAGSVIAPNAATKLTKIRGEFTGFKIPFGWADNSGRNPVQKSWKNKLSL